MMLKEFTVSCVLKTLYLFLFPFCLFPPVPNPLYFKGPFGVCCDHDGMPNMLSVILIVLGQ